MTEDGGQIADLAVASPLVLKGVPTTPLEHAAKCGVDDVVKGLLSVGAWLQPGLALLIG